MIIYCINRNLLYNWLQLTHATPKTWKHILKENLDIRQNLVYLNYHLIKNNRLVSIEKLDSKDLYNIIISNTKFSFKNFPKEDIKQ